MVKIKGLFLSQQSPPSISRTQFPFFIGVLAQFWVEEFFPLIAVVLPLRDHALSVHESFIELMVNETILVYYLNV
jgi:hypothetical protein